MLYIMHDLDYIDNIVFQKTYNQIMMISKSLSGFITYLKTQPKKS